LREIDTPLSADALIVINPQDSVSIGGPVPHAGLTGRKNDIDTYGGYSRHGGAALSGKDPSRIDRTGAYLARYAAKNVVASELAQECEVQISYAMGRQEPVSVEIDTFGSSRVPEPEILRAAEHDRLQRGFYRADIPLGRAARPPRPLFARLAAFGHFSGPDLSSWEATNKADALKKLFWRPRPSQSHAAIAGPRVGLFDGERRFSAYKVRSRQGHDMAGGELA
jgi:S-adenosylmethionine synthetase